ncbi:MAG: shikimate kinase [Bacteroidaceae bacterium]|nr:shikimate kinase [Bacteroidaceae bacterium]
MMKIALIGYMGAGKTTLGKALARQMGLQFYDLDWWIEEKAGCTIAQIFAQQGEDAFREMERQALHEVMQKDDIVLSVGGGTPCFFDNIDYMNSQANTVYLNASVETLKAHIRMGGSKRPLVDGKSDEELTAYITTSLQKRESYYRQATYQVQIATITREEQIENYVEEIQRRISC